MTAEGPPGVYRRKSPVFSNLRFFNRHQIRHSKWVIGKFVFLKELRSKE